MYRFDPTLVQIVLAAASMLCAGYAAAWAVIRGDDRAGEETGQGVEYRPEAGSAEQPLEARQKVILWTAAGAAALFLLWWATLSTGSRGAPPL